jgi:hypothetical protein
LDIQQNVKLKTFSYYIKQKNDEYIKKLLNHNLINNNNEKNNEFPKAFIYQFLYGYELLINKSLYRLDKEYFYLNNIEEIDQDFDSLRKKYITEKHLEWLKKHTFYLEN